MNINLETLISDSEIATETALTLSLPWEVGGVQIPPPSAGAIIALEAIQSPFVTECEDFKIVDFYRALYCIYDSQEACRLIFSCAQIMEQYERLKDDRILEYYTVKIDNYNQQITEFIAILDNFDYFAEVQNLMQYIKLSMAGFEMIRSEKKTTDK